MTQASTTSNDLDQNGSGNQQQIRPVQPAMIQTRMEVTITKISKVRMEVVTSNDSGVTISNIEGINRSGNLQ